MEPYELIADPELKIQNDPGHISDDAVNKMYAAFLDAVAGATPWVRSW